MLIQEWKNLFRSKIMVLSVIVLALIPIIYAGILLSSYWDPFGKTSNLAVAVVNEDKEQELEGTEINIGQELVENLKTNKDFEWHFVDANTAQKGYEDGDYYIVMTIPNDFSKNATTVLDTDVQKMNLDYQVNPGRNYFIQTVGKQAMESITNEISTSVTKEYAKTIFSIIEELGDGLADASEGATRLDDGTEEIQSGSSELAENLKKLASSTLTFQSGTEKIQVAISELVKGTKDLKTGASLLNDGVVQYTDGINQLQQKTSTLTDSEKGVPQLAKSQTALNEGIQSLEVGGQALEGGLKELNSQLPSNDEITQLITALAGIQASITKIEEIIQANPDASEELKTQLATLKATADVIQPKASEALTGLADVHTTFETKILPNTSKLTSGLSNVAVGSEQLATATNQFAQQIPTLTSAINQLATKGQELRNGSQSLYEGTDKLASGVPVLADGIAKVTSASGELSNATGLLADGSLKLNDGVDKLKEGTKELSEKLQEGSEEVNSVKADDNTYDMISSPIEMAEIKENDVPNYGHALAPNFISLALFIGAIAFNLIYPIAKPSTEPTSIRAWWLSKFSIIFVQATASALILDAIMLFVIQLEVANKGLFVFMSLLVSLTYMSLVSFLVMAFDNPGRFVATILMVLQLASSGGMFPTELQSEFFQALNPYMLMTYSVFGFREAMTNAIGHAGFIQSILVLAAILILSNLFMLVSIFVKKKRKRYQV